MAIPTPWAALAEPPRPCYAIAKMGKASMADERSKPLWQPSPERIAAANLTRFMAEAKARWNVDAKTYADLYAWSVSKPEQFWQSVWDFGDVIGETRRQGAGRRRQDAGRALFPGRPAQLRREPAAPLERRRERRHRVPGRGQGEAAACPGASCTTRSVPPGAGVCAAGHQARRPGRRLRAEYAGDGGRRRWPPRRSAPSGRPARRISARRACSTASARSSPKLLLHRRRLFLQRQAASIPWRGSRSSCRSCRAWSRSWCCPISAARPTSRELPKAKCAWAMRSSHSRRGHSSSSALPFNHPLFIMYSVGHDRRAEMHRARRRRHAAAAPEGASLHIATSGRTTGCSTSPPAAG